MGYMKNAPKNAKAKKNKGGIGKDLIYIEYDDLFEMPSMNADETIYIDDIKLKPGARAHILKQVHGNDKTGFLTAVDQGATEGSSWKVSVEYSISGLEPSHIHFANLMVRGVDTLQLVKDGANRWRLAGEEGWPLMKAAGGITLGTGENAAAFAGGNYKFETSQNNFPGEYRGDIQKLLLEVPLAQTVSTATATEATLNWNALEDTTITDFQVEISTTSDFATVDQTQDVTGNSFAVTGLTANTLYYFRVSSKSTTGVVGLPSNVISFQTASV